MLYAYIIIRKMTCWTWSSYVHTYNSNRYVPTIYVCTYHNWLISWLNFDVSILFLHVIGLRIKGKRVTLLHCLWHIDWKSNKSNPCANENKEKCHFSWLLREFSDWVRKYIRFAKTNFSVKSTQLQINHTKFPKYHSFNFLTDFKFKKL